MQKIKKVLIIVNLLKNDAQSLVGEITSHMSSLGIESEVFAFEGKPPCEPRVNNVDLAFSLGGDGTVLYSARVLSPHHIPVFAVNIGDFGFITEVSKNEWISAFEKYVDGKLGISQRLMLKARVIRNGKTAAEFSGMNDAVISAAGISKIVRLQVALSKTPIGKYRADGIIVATPTGSTAYSAAAGGPILDPELEALIINPICPFTLSNRPLVVHADEIINVEVDENQRAEVIMTVDGQVGFHLMPKDKIIISRMEEKALIIRSDKRNFFEVLRSKLSWSGGPYA
jgi:NAD+ kinase